MSPDDGGGEYKVSAYIVAAQSAYHDRDGEATFRPVFSTRSGTSMMVSETLFEQLMAGKVPPQPAVVAQLAAAEMLVAETADGASEFDELRRRNMQTSRDQNIATFNVSPTSFCNFGCVYCGQSHSKGRIGDNTIAAIERRVAAAAARPGTDRVHLCWFGGEPSAALDIVDAMSRRLIAICADAGVQYSSDMVTNGSLLDVAAIRHLVEQCKITRFCITIDGPREIHDRSRPSRNGRGSFDHILSLLAQVVADTAFADAEFTVRTNVSNINRAALFQLFEECADRGLGEGNINFQLIPVYAWSNDVSEFELDKRDYAQFEVTLIDHMLSLGLKVALLPETPHPIVCVAVDPRAEVVGPDGACFSCTEHVLVPAHASDAIGKVASMHGPRPKGAFDDFNRTAVRELPCKSCVMFGICGGACPKHWREGSEPCPSFKYNLRERLDLGAVRSGLLAVG